MRENAKKWSRREWAIVVLVAMSPAMLPARARADANPEIPLYEILDGEGHVVAYLAGSTHHVPESLEVPKFLGRKIGGASFVAVEFHAPSTDRPAVEKQGFAMDSPTSALLDKYLDKANGKVIPELRGNRPSTYGARKLVGLLIENEHARQKVSRHAGLDAYVARRPGVKLKSLETVAQHTQAYAGVSDAHWNAYVAGHLAVLLGQHASSTDVLGLPGCEAVRNAMLTNRSEIFANTMLGLLATVGNWPPVIVMGHGHLSQVIARLLAAGYRSRRINADDGTPSSPADGSAPPPPGGGGGGLSAGAGAAAGGGGLSAGAGAAAGGDGLSASATAAASSTVGGSASALPPAVTHADPDVRDVLAEMEARTASRPGDTQRERQAALRRLNPTIPAGLATGGGAPVDLREAVRSGDVYARVEGAGGVASVRLTLTNRDSAAWRTVLIPAGMIFKSSSNYSQNMAVR